MSRPSASSREYIARIHAVLEYINTHAGEDLSLQALAHVASFSAFHFHRIFTALVNETPGDFVKRVRLQRAALMLLHNPDHSITDIALESGFSSSAVFSRAFRGRFGMSASEWRNTGGTQFSKNRKTVRKKGKAFPFRTDYLASTINRMEHAQERRIAMDVTIKDLPGKHIAYVANLGGYKTDLIRAAWEKICGWAEPLGLLAPPAEVIGISFDDPDITPADKCRYYACITIPEGVTPPRDIGVMNIPAGRYAVMPFDGKREDIAGAYKQFYGSWLPRSGFQPEDRPCFEVYHSSPDEDPEGRFVMDICMPVRPL